MRYLGKLSWWCISLLLVLGLQTSYASDPERPGAFKRTKLEPLTDLTTESPVRMSLIFFTKGDYGDTLTFQVVGTNGLVTVGPDTQTISVDEDGNFVTEFQIRIPYNDTSCLEVRARPLTNRHSHKVWFVTTEDTVEYWKGHPRMYNGPFRSDPPTGRRGWIIPGEFPDMDSIYGIPPEMIHPDYRPDSTPKQQFPSYTDAEIEAAVLEKRRQDMREFEKSPLTGAGTQWIKIGDTMWTRRYGETKFRVAQPITDFKAHEQAMRDSLLAIPPATMYDVLYQVKDTGQVATLREHIDNLEPTRRADVYRCRISKGLIDMLAEHYRLTPTFVDQNPESLRDLFDSEPSPDLGDPDQEGRLDGPDKGTEIFYSEDFEYGWPALWTAWDVLPEYGNDYWGISTLESTSGSRSIWCNGVGDKPDGGPYDDGMLAKTQNVDPFIVQYWHNERMRYQVWTDMPPAGYDYFGFYFSAGNDTWFQMRTLRGTFGWTEYEDWFMGGDSLYFQFIFQSGINTFYRGAYIDDVVLRGTPYPNLKPVQPDGWENPMVLSSEQGTHQTGTLYGEEPTFVDFAVTNNQIGDAGPFSVGLFIGYTLYGSWDFAGLASGDTIIVEDAEVVFPVGEHIVVLKIDYVGGPGGEVDEIMELDNEWDDTYTFQDARIGFQGYLNYVDPTANPDTTIPLRGYTIALWDHNYYPLPYDSLASATTDDSGYFVLGPVENDDFWGTGYLDVFFRVYSSNDAADVVVNHNGETQYWETPYVDNVPSGMYDTTMTADEDESGRFFVADVIRNARTKWQTLVGGSFPNQIEVDLDAEYTSCYYDPDSNYIHVETGFDPDNYRPHTFARDPITHEYMHYMQHSIGFFNGGVNNHYWSLITDSATAAREGFAYFMPPAMAGDSLYRYMRYDFADTLWRNLESGTHGEDGFVYSDNPNNSGDSVEGAVACLLYDIFDSHDDDFSTFGVYSNQPIPDLVGDNFTDGLGNILDVVTIHHPEHIMEFWRAWFSYPGLGNCQKMQDIFYEHGIDMSTNKSVCTCCIVRGNVDGDPGGTIDISDLVYLVDLMFTGGPLPPCFEEADMNGSGGIDISDLVWLVDYVFTGGPPPLAC